MTDEPPRGPSTRAVRAGRSEEHRPGEPLGPPVVLAAPYALPGPGIDSSPYTYGRYVNPTWEALEGAMGDLEGGGALVFGSGMAAIDATVRAIAGRDGKLVAPVDGYPGIRALAPDAHLVATGTDAYVAACEGAALVFVETPSNPKLRIVDIAAVAEAAHAAGALLAVDNTVATALGQQPLALGADLSVSAGTKALSGHSDLLLGVVAARDPEVLERVHAIRSQAGNVVGPFEAWIAHRSLATLDLRLARASATAQALADELTERGIEVWHPSRSPVAARQMIRFGPLVSFDLGSADAAQRFLGAAELVTEATSFGGVHTTAERRERWGTDAVGPGFVRLSAGIEDTADVLADVLAALP